jgi:hypothetical protein
LKNELAMMEEFHRAFGHPILMDEGMGLNNIRLRCRLQSEEHGELLQELWNVAITEKISSNLLKEGADLLYVLLGTFVSLGLGNELVEAYRRVHISNMSKLGEDGKPIYRDDGKVLKGPNYKPPDLNDLVPYDCPQCRGDRKTKLMSIHRCGCV